MRVSLLASACLALTFAAGCGEPEEKLTGPAAVNAKRIENADAEPGQWLTAGRNYDEQRFSPLAQITPDNIGTLGLAWFADFDTNRGQEATPVVVDGVMYVSTAWSKVKAYDARTGKALWEYDPEVPGRVGRQCLLRRGQPRRRGVEGQGLCRHDRRPAGRARRRQRQGQSGTSAPSTRPNPTRSPALRAS